MTLHWLERGRTERGWRLELCKRGSDDWTPVQLRTRPFADTKTRHHSARLTGLSPNQGYAFRLWQGDRLHRQAWFQTAPATLHEPLTFVTGGDMHTRRSIPMSRRAGLEEPLFALLGGDLAYANGRDAHRWYSWVDLWSRLAVSPHKRMIPMVVAIGNHETGSGLSSERLEGTRMHPNAKFFYSFFELPQRLPYYSLDFGSYLSIIVLDSDHTVAVEDQTAWLETALAERSDRPHLFAVYHRPAWGTGVKENQENIQQEWCPLFERFGVDCVFENDHHTYKRTHPLTAGRPDFAHGVLYLGDGAWGQNVREVTAETIRSVGGDTYLAAWGSVQHFIKVTIRPQTQHFEAILPEGTIFDHTTRWTKR